MKVRVGELKDGKTADKDEVTGEMVAGWGRLVIGWIWKFFPRAF